MFYLLAFSVRSGSNYLCDHLRSSGFGLPSEYFQTRDSDFLWYDQVDLQPGQPIEYTKAMVKKKSANGVFGAKVQWDNKNFLFHIAKPDPEVSKTLGTAKWIHLKRADKIGQAISAWKAEATNLWTSQHKSTGEVQLTYDFGRIAELLHSFCVEDYIWESWFSRNGIQPFVIGYEEYLKSRHAIFRRLAKYLASDTPLNLEDFPIQYHSGYKMQRDAHSAEIKERFLSDLDQRGT